MKKCAKTYWEELSQILHFPPYRENIQSCQIAQLSDKNMSLATLFQGVYISSTVPNLLYFPSSSVINHKLCAISSSYLLTELTELDTTLSH